METIRPVVELFFMLQTNLNESISKITELINDLLYPNNPASATVRPDQITDQIEKAIIDPVQEQNIKFKVIIHGKENKTNGYNCLAISIHYFLDCSTQRKNGQIKGRSR